MKIKPEHYKSIKDAMSKVHPDIIKNNMEVLKGIKGIKNVNKALRWSILHISGIKIGDGEGMNGLPLYSYLNDSHIDTALKSIMKEIEKENEEKLKKWDMSCPECSNELVSFGFTGSGTLYRCTNISCKKEWVIAKYIESY